MNLLKEVAAVLVVASMFLVLAAIVSIPVGLAMLLWRAVFA